MDRFVDTVGLLSRACGVVAALLLMAAVLVVCEMVVMRYFLNASTIWQTEFVIYSLVAGTFIGSPYVALERGHVNVDLLPLYLGQRARMVLALLASAGSLLFALVIAWTGFGMWHEAWVGGWITDTVWELPLWIPYLPLPVGIGLLALQYVADIACLLSGRDMPFGLSPEDRP